MTANFDKTTHTRSEVLLADIQHISYDDYLLEQEEVDPTFKILIPENYTIVIADTHGKSIWKDIIMSNKYWSHVVFLGDYFDSFTIPFEQQADNFKEILEFKRMYSDKVTLLIGNHDYQYMYQNYMTEKYSGFQELNYKEIEVMFQEAIDQNLLRAALYLENYNALFTHAGVTDTWLNTAINTIPAFEKFNIETITPMQTASLINDCVFVEDEYSGLRRELFLVHNKGSANTYGDDAVMSPFWVRPRSLALDHFYNNNVLQIVGHTMSEKIVKHPISHPVIIITDCLDYSRQYVVLEDNGTDAYYAIKSF